MEKKIMKIMNAVVPIHQYIQLLLGRNVMVEEESAFMKLCMR